MTMISPLVAYRNVTVSNRKSVGLLRRGGGLDGGTLLVSGDLGDLGELGNIARQLSRRDVTPHTHIHKEAVRAAVCARQVSHSHWHLQMHTTLETIAKRMSRYVSERRHKL